MRVMRKSEAAKTGEVRMRMSSYFKKQERARTGLVRM